jgi:hypothetical protein
LDRVQHTLLLTAEKIFIESERKMPIFDIFWAATANKFTESAREKASRNRFLRKFTSKTFDGCNRVVG